MKLAIIVARARALKKQKQKGFSVLDLVIWVGAVFVLLAILFAVVPALRSNSDALRVEQELLGLNAAIGATYSTQTTFGTADITSYLASSSDVPATLKRAGSAGAITLTNKWGGAVTVVGATTSYSINYAGLPKAVCNKTLTRLRAQDWTTVSAGGAALALPVPPATADAACAASTTDLVLTSSGT